MLKLNQMNRIRDIKNEIIEKYKFENKIFSVLVESAKNHLDPFVKELLDEVKREKSDNIDNNLSEKKEEIDKEEHPILEQNSEIREIPFENIRDRIEKRLEEILERLNILLFGFKKNELKELLKKDFDEYLSRQMLNINKEELYNYIEEIIDKKFHSYLINKKTRQKSLLYNYLNKMLKEINSFFETNNYERLKQLSILQKRNLLKFFLLQLYKKYLDNDKNIGLLNGEEYDFLKEKIKSFVLFKYEKALRGEL